MCFLALEPGEELFGLSSTQQVAMTVLQSLHDRAMFALAGSFSASAFDLMTWS